MFFADDEEVCVRGSDASPGPSRLPELASRGEHPASPVWHAPATQVLAVHRVEHPPHPAGETAPGLGILRAPGDESEDPQPIVRRSEPGEISSEDPLEILGAAFRAPRARQPGPREHVHLLDRRPAGLRTTLRTAPRPPPRGPEGPLDDGPGLPWSGGPTSRIPSEAQSQGGPQALPQGREAPLTLSEGMRPGPWDCPRWDPEPPASGASKGRSAA